MKFFLILTLLMSLPCYSQSASPGHIETKGQCSPVLTGDGNTVTLTCYNVDRKLADQIGQLVADSKRDDRSLKEISKKLDALFTEVRDANSVRVEIVPISSNEPTQVPHSLTNRSGMAYTSKWRVILSGSVPSFFVSASGPVIDLGIIPEGMGVKQTIMGRTDSGSPYEQLSNAFGRYILVIESIGPGTIQPIFKCSGVRCIGPS
jgi:hypothetical protein